MAIFMIALTVIMSILLCLGILFVCMTFYNSFLQYPVHRLRGGTRDNYRHSSGVPLAGALLLILALPLGWDRLWVRWVAIPLILIDIGGLLLGYILYWLKKRKRMTVDGTGSDD